MDNLVVFSLIMTTYRVPSVLTHKAKLSGGLSLFSRPSSWASWAVL